MVTSSITNDDCVCSETAIVDCDILVTDVMRASDCYTTPLCAVVTITILLMTASVTIAT